MIKPTVGRIVWYWQHGRTQLDANEQPQAAIVCYVWGDRMVNLAWFDSNGGVRTSTSVTLMQEGDGRPEFAYCEWMPFQKGQAAKAETAAASA